LELFSKKKVTKKISVIQKNLLKKFKKIRVEQKYIDQKKKIYLKKKNTLNFKIKNLVI
jgi:hypothetical protein